MASTTASITVQMSDEVRSFVNATRINFCLARQCRHNYQSQCQYKSVGITDEGRCDSFSVKIPRPPRIEE